MNDISNDTGKPFTVDSLGIHRNQDGSIIRWVKGNSLGIASNKKEAMELLLLGYRIVIG